MATSNPRIHLSLHLSSQKSYQFQPLFTSRYLVIMAIHRSTPYLTVSFSLYYVCFSNSQKIGVDFLGWYRRCFPNIFTVSTFNIGCYKMLQDTRQYTVISATGGPSYPRFPSLTSSSLAAGLLGITCGTPCMKISFNSGVKAKTSPLRWGKDLWQCEGQGGGEVNIYFFFGLFQNYLTFGWHMLVPLCT